MKLLVVTSVLNPGNRLEATRRSIMTQSLDDGDEVIHVIWDGFSTDGTFEFLQTELFSSALVLRGKDKGLYDSLAKVFTSHDADIYAYLNAGDIWFPNAAKSIFSTFKQSQNILWISGRQTIVDSQWQFLSSRLPPRFLTDFIRKGIYNGKGLSTIQQESTFWRKNLHDIINWDLFASLELAGDAFLWNQFSKVSAPAVLDAQLGGFMIHEGHLSSDMTKYRKEICSFSEQPNILDLTKKRIEFLLWRIPDAFKHIFFKNIIRNSIN